MSPQKAPVPKLIYCHHIMKAEFLNTILGDKGLVIARNQLVLDNINNSNEGLMRVRKRKTDI